MSAVFLRDLRLAFSGGGGFGQGLGFFALFLFLCLLALGGDSRFGALIPALIFLAVIFSGLLSLDRLFREDMRDGTLTQLRLAPVPLVWILLSKALVHWITTGLSMTLLSPLIWISLGENLEGLGLLMLALLIATPALSLMGMVGAALTLSIRRSSLIQAFITLPFYIPTLIFGIEATGQNSNHVDALLWLLAITVLALLLAPFASVKIIESY